MMSDPDSTQRRTWSSLSESKMLLYQESTRYISQSLSPKTVEIVSDPSRCPSPLKTTRDRNP